jgi:hypothetical protein
MTEMKLPETIKVGAHEYEVVFPHRFQEVDGYLGLHDSNIRRIMIAEVDWCGNDRKPTDVYKTFIHEILHAVDNVYLKGRIGEEGDEEKIIDSLAEGLLQVLLDCNLLRPITREKTE